MTDLQLIEACKRKESFAQRLLYERYVDKLFLLCLRYIPDATNAEEVLSDSFMKCFNNIEKFEYAGDGSIRAWLSKIAVNECLMFLRKKKAIYIPMDQEFHSNELKDVLSAINHLSIKETLSQIQKLPAGYRTVLNLYIFEEKTHKEIAGLLGISENTSKSQLFKARALLKQMLGALNEIKSNHS